MGILLFSNQVPSLSSHRMLAAESFKCFVTEVPRSEILKIDKGYLESKRAPSVCIIEQASTSRNPIELFPISPSANEMKDKSHLRHIHLHENRELSIHQKAHPPSHNVKMIKTYITTFHITTLNDNHRKTNDKHQQHPSI